MYKISKQNRDTIVKYLDSSALPHGDVKTLLAVLMELEEIKEEVIKEQTT